jgi:GxxExxY protein
MTTHDDTLTGRVIDGIISVHRELGPGFSEDVYRNALVIELQENGLNVEVNREIAVSFRGQEVGKHLLDILVEGEVLVIIRNASRLSKEHYAQARSYLNLAGLERALLVTFAPERADFRRVEL